MLEAWKHVSLKDIQILSEQLMEPSIYSPRQLTHFTPSINQLILTSIAHFSFIIDSYQPYPLKVTLRILAPGGFAHDNVATAGAVLTSIWFP